MKLIPKIVIGLLIDIIAFVAISCLFSKEVIIIKLLFTLTTLLIVTCGFAVGKARSITPGEDRLKAETPEFLSYLFISLLILIFVIIICFFYSFFAQ